MTYPIPPEAFDDRLAVTGTSGAGKTYTVLGALARLAKRGSRFIAADPLGVMYGLRLKPDGVTPSDLKPVIFGGPHGDLPLSVGAAALIGETAATMAESCILDLSELGTKALERRFMLGFLTALYRYADRQPVHLVFDEADMFAPQRLDDKEGEAAKLLGMMETVIRRGRVRGFIPWLITQRPAVLNKNVLSQADGVIAMKLTSSQDRDAIGAWIEGAADKATGKDILALLPTLGRGEGVVWLPGRGLLKTAKFPENSTFDSSQTPGRGAARRTVDLKPLDLGKLKDRLAKVEQEAKANDPAALKSQLAAVRAELAKAQKTSQPVEKTNTQPDARALNAAHGQGFVEGWETGFKTGHQTGYKLAASQTTKAVVTAIHSVQMEIPEPVVPKSPKGAASFSAGLTPDQARKASGLPTSDSPTFPRVVLPKTAKEPLTASGLKPSLQRVLDAIAWWRVIGKDPVSRDQAAVVAGLSPKASTFGVYVADLVKSGLVATSPGMVGLTDAGVAAANTPDLATSEDIRITARNLLTQQGQRVFDVVYAAHGGPVTRLAIADALGLSHTASTCGVYIAGVAQYGIIETAGPGMVKAADWLFV